jgi:DTW domain-containing protein YfiP
MSKRRSPAENKCPQCKIQMKLCFCSDIEPVENKIKVSIIMHHREEHLTTNTAKLATRMLKNSKICMRGLIDHPFVLSDLDILDDETPYFLFPSTDAAILDEKFIELNTDKKIHLIVPDGTWNQAKKVYRREKDLHFIKCVKLPNGISSHYRLRKAPRADGVCTFEAISYSLNILESNTIHQKLMHVFDVMVERFIKARYTFHND